jgi:predicted pyridoxine 5'-phosphate oxidase superfamily flavin-nucleotide-binding protein
MGRVHDVIDQRLASWIERQPLFFVATAPLDGDGLINCSPKGNRDELAVVGPDRVAYLEQTGSGVETIAHLLENGRIVVMLCAFDGAPRIVRLHGRGVAHPVGSARFTELAGHFPAASGVGVRSIIEVAVDRIADSCGYGVPLMDFRAHRDTMDTWSARKGADGIARYQDDNNAVSLDGLDGLPAARRVGGG